MLNFQTDYDEATGEQVLTCFLLPQMEYQAEQMGKLSKKYQWCFLSANRMSFFFSFLKKII